MNPSSTRAIRQDDDMQSAGLTDGKTLSCGFTDVYHQNSHVKGLLVDARERSPFRSWHKAVKFTPERREGESKRWQTSTARHAATGSTTATPTESATACTWAPRPPPASWPSASSTRPARDAP